MIRKIIIILIAISALKLITSCIFRCDCDDPEEVEFSLNTSQISTIDNAGPYPDYNTKTDSIPAGAIGFNIKLSDSTLMEKYYMVAAPKSQCRIFPYFIKGAYAWSCYCVSWEFNVRQKPEAIRLVALSDFNNEIPANTDISHLMVGHVDQSDFEGHGMYKSLSKTISYLSEERIYNSPEFSFELYLTEATTADSIQFEITFEFDDNSFITDTTQTIYPLPTPDQ